LGLAIEQVRAGKHPEKTAQQAASEFLLARHAAHDADASFPIVAMKSEQVHRARDRNPAFTPMTTEPVERIDSTDSFGRPRLQRSPAPATSQTLAVAFPGDGGPSLYQNKLLFPSPIERRARVEPETSLLQSAAPLDITGAGTSVRPGDVPFAFFQRTPVVSTHLSAGVTMADALPMPPTRTPEPPAPLILHEPAEPLPHASMRMIEAFIVSRERKRQRKDELSVSKRQRIDEIGSSIATSAASIDRLGTTWPPMSADDRAHLENVASAFSAYQDVLRQKNMAMPTFLATFDELRNVTHEWMNSLSSRPMAAHLLATLCKIAASWPAQTKAGLPAEIDTSAFNVMINLPLGAAKTMYEWIYQINPMLRQVFDYQRALIMQEAGTTERGPVLPQAAATPSPRNEGSGTEGAPSPNQPQQPIEVLVVDTKQAVANIGTPSVTTEGVVKANVQNQKDIESAWKILKAFEAAGIKKDIPAVQKLINDICPMLARFLETQIQDERKVGRDIMFYLLSLVLQVSRRFSLENSRKEIAQMLLNHAGKDAKLCNCAYDVWKNENFQGSNMLPIWTGLKKLIDHKEALRYAAVIVAAELAAIDANIAAFST
jgi:hypothetical protein